MVSERSLTVLHAIVADFVSDGEPVGSKAIAQRHPIGVSAATIRNDMAQLEEEELIVAPHTSSGRVPTDKGYRLYVDTLSKIRPISAAQRNAIERFLSEAQDLDDVMARTVRLLASLTNQVAVVQYPSLRRTTVKHLELLEVGQGRVLCVMITGSGVVEQHVARVDDEHRLTEEWLHELRGRVAGVIVGYDAEEASARLKELADDETVWPDLAQARSAHRIIAAVLDQLHANHSQRMTISGTANLTKPSEFNPSLPAVLEAIEEQVTLLRLFQELATDDRGVGSSIGRENIPYGLEHAAVIATQYESDAVSASRVGVLGPTRMDYAGNIATVRAVARYLNKLLEESST